MIEAICVTKYFDAIKAVDKISATIKEENVYGLVGSNGAGKSTFLRLLSGILKPDKGMVTIDNMEVYENVNAKRLFFYISDEQHFFSNATPLDIKKYYGVVYPEFDGKRFDILLEQFGLNGKRKINTFSKGMKKQISIICGICANTKYLFCDETFDGLDPVMRQAVKSIFANEIAGRGLTPIIASHNLRELEDICDHVGLLHKGGILFSRDLEEMKISIHKIQCVFQNEEDEGRAVKGLDMIHFERRGSLCLITARGSKEDIIHTVGIHNPLFFETIPLSLEEIFISETEVAGYDIKKFIS